MQLIIAPDSFKGTLTAGEVCEIISVSVRKYCPDAQVATLPLSDGGDGFTESYFAAIGGERVSAPVSGPFGEPLFAPYVMLQNRTAVLEMAAASGILLAGERRDPLHATMRGVGEMLLDAKRKGASAILLGLGGSATNDGGIGMASALGYRFIGKRGEEIPPFACNLRAIEHIVSPDLPFSLPIHAAYDVDNPLCGPHGASHVFGPQKGADARTADFLDEGLAHLADVIARDLGVDVLHLSGAGAAGGLGAGIKAFCGGILTPGIELFLDTVGFDAMLERADVVLTGEGRMDAQTAHGKAPVGVARRCAMHHIPCYAFCGALDGDLSPVYAQGITAAFAASTNSDRPLDEIRRTCREELRALSDRVLPEILAKWK